MLNKKWISFSIANFIVLSLGALSSLATTLEPTSLNYPSYFSYDFTQAIAATTPGSNWVFTVGYGSANPGSFEIAGNNQVGAHNVGPVILPAAVNNLSLGIVTLDPSGSIWLGVELNPDYSACHVQGAQVTETMPQSGWILYEFSGTFNGPIDTVSLQCSDAFSSFFVAQVGGSTGYFVSQVTVGTQAFDLSVTTPQISESNPSTDSNGLTIVLPGSPFTVNVPVSGSGFNNPETRTTSVTLQAGSQPLQTQTINLADIQAAGGTLIVPFTVTFGAQDTGIQTITATVDPGNALDESNFSNNTASVQVDAQPQYELIAMVNGTPIADSGGSLQLEPTIKPCGTGGYANPPAPTQVPVQIQCVSVADPSQTVSGCQFLLDLSLGPDKGGHNHDLDDETRPFVLDTAPANFSTGKFLPVDDDGSNLVYVPPEVSGDVILEITGIDPNGNSINGPTYTFHIQSSLALIDLNGTGATSSNPGISIVTASHPGEGTYGAGSMQEAVSKMVARYYQLAAEQGDMNPDQLASQAATLIEGGLFDANWDGGIYAGLPTPWTPPHCGHRNGVTIDLSINQLEGNEQDWLEQAADYAGFNFTSPGERPQDENATHWHAVLGTL